VVSLRRTTSETDIVASLCVRGSCQWLGFTGIGLLDHLLAQYVVNSQVDLKLFCYGDLWTDWHHSVEDIGIVVGMLIAAVYSKAQYNRFASVSVPMDGSLTRLSVDFSGRPRLF